CCSRNFEGKVLWCAGKRYETDHYPGVRNPIAIHVSGASERADGLSAIYNADVSKGERSNSTIRSSCGSLNNFLAQHGDAVVVVPECRGIIRESGDDRVVHLGVRKDN